MSFSRRSLLSNAAVLSAAIAISRYSPVFPGPPVAPATPPESAHIKEEAAPGQAIGYSVAELPKIRPTAAQLDILNGRSWTLNQEVELIEQPPQWGDAWRTYKKGLKHVTLELNGFYDTDESLAALGISNMFKVGDRLNIEANGQLYPAVVDRIEGDNVYFTGVKP